MKHHLIRWNKRINMGSKTLFYCGCGEISELRYHYRKPGCLRLYSKNTSISECKCKDQLPTNIKTVHLEATFLSEKRSKSAARGSSSNSQREITEPGHQVEETIKLREAE
jgi:hypothetical protein